ncbi:hypothetical protein QIH04_27810 [Klebsiella pneumoniae]|nr:hypothetical protein [Klebsiella pneumoniae]
MSLIRANFTSADVKSLSPNIVDISDGEGALVRWKISKGVER